MKFDLHCHSHFSDGKHSPPCIIDLARSRQVTHLAITDHDCVDAFQHLPADTGEIGIIPGVEISCAWESLEIHVVGLQIDLHNASLLQLLARQQAARRQRMLAIGERLISLGISGLSEYVAALPCVSQTRTHVADFLVEKGVCKNREKAFTRFLARKAPAYVAATWCPLSDAIAAIVNSGGFAVLAHPDRYPLGRNRRQALAGAFRAAGGQAMEVSYGNLDPRKVKSLVELARSNDLMLSVGSDFHDQQAHWTAPGKFPSLPSDAIKNAIWEHPRWHSLDGS